MMQVLGYYFMTTL